VTSVGDSRWHTTADRPLSTGHHSGVAATVLTAEPRVAATSTPRAVLFSALTTIASFGSLALSRHLGLASMGLLLTIAILWSLVCTLIVLPSVISLVGKAGRGERTS